MRTRAMITATLAVAMLAASLAVPTAPVAAEPVPPPKVFVTLFATVVNGNFVFVGPDGQNPDKIVVQSVPAVLNITIVAREGTPHTFTIRSAESQTPLVDLDLPAAAAVQTVELTLYAADRVIAQGRNETAQTEGGRVKFVCRPHEALRMVGFLVVGGVQEKKVEPAKGVFLRAYWIGLLGIAATLLLVVISYFVIKGSSRHYTDHHEHIRRGGP